MIKKKFLIILACFFSATIIAQIYTPADAGSSVKFSIKNFGLNVGGSFTGVQGKITFSPANLAASNFLVTVDASTVNTGNGSRDGHLKKEDYFDVAKFPKLQFVSKKIIAGNKTGQYIMEGLLTIKGTAKTISFPFTATTSATGCLFTGEFKINRRDFKVGSGSLVLSDMLTVSLHVAARK